jgi:CspA family cold shock protein
LESFFKEVNDMADGTVKWFSEKKGYGFIKLEDDSDLFMHISSIKMPEPKTLGKGDHVSFEIEQTERGPKAKNVRKL